MKKTIFTRKNQQGFSLIELVGVLATIAILIAITVVGLKKLTSSSNLGSAVQEAGLISSAIKSTYKVQGDFNGLTNAVILKSNVINDNMRVKSEPTLVRSPWLKNGATVAPTTIDSADDAFTITYHQVPEFDCTDFSTKLINSFEKVDVNGTVITGVSDAATACTTTNEVTLTDRIR